MIQTNLCFSKIEGSIIPETKFNLKWLFKLFFRKQKAVCTNASRVLVYLSVLLYKLLKNEKDTYNSFFVSNDMVEVYPVVFSNDGTALKPSIQFDEDRNVNVGLENHEMTLEQYQSKPFLEKKLLLEKLNMRSCCLLCYQPE